MGTAYTSQYISRACQFLPAVQVSKVAVQLKLRFDDLFPFSVAAAGPSRTSTTRKWNIFSNNQSGALSLVGIVEILLSLVVSFTELKYFQDVTTPALLCHKEPARRIQSLLLAPRWFFMA